MKKRQREIVEVTCTLTNAFTTIWLATMSASLLGNEWKQVNLIGYNKQKYDNLIGYNECKQNSLLDYNEWKHDWLATTSVSKGISLKNKFYVKVI